MTPPPAARFRRILLTGGTGFMGGHLRPLVCDAWPDAERLALLRPGDHAAPPGFERRAVDLCDGGAVGAEVGRFKPDLVIHLAAQASVGAARDAAADTWRINFGATLALAQACARHVPATTFFFSSTAEVYGASLNDGPAGEDTAPRPVNAYARSKWAAEMAIEDLLPPEATVLIARAFNHAGPGQDTRFVLPSFAAQIAQIEAGARAPRLLVGNLEARRDFLDVRDVAQAYLDLMRAAPPGGRGVYNVASGVCRRIGDLLEGLRALSSRPFEIAVDPARDRPSEIAMSVGRADKLRAATGFTPRFDFGTTLRDVLDDHRRRIETGLAS